jgi:hypothetical protein
LCGVLDENGHKLCLPLDKRCPINRIAVNKIPSDGYNYTSVKIDNITLYYTNEAIKDGRIIKSIMADSTINILNDCEILDIIPLKDLMEYNRNIYSEQKNIITSEDKAYLKWCPAFNYGLTDLTKKREEYKIYLNIKNINEYIVKPLNDNKDNNDANIAKFMGTVIHIIGLYLFASTLIRKYKRKNTGEHCMDTFGGLNLFGILYGFPCMALAAFSLEYQGLLEKIIKNIENYNIKNDYLSTLSTLKRINLAYSIIGILLIFYLWASLITCFCLNGRCCENDNRKYFEEKNYYSLKI